MAKKDSGFGWVGIAAVVAGVLYALHNSSAAEAPAGAGTSTGDAGGNVAAFARDDVYLGPPIQYDTKPVPKDGPTGVRNPGRHPLPPVIDESIIRPLPPVLFDDTEPLYPIDENPRWGFPPHYDPPELIVDWTPPPDLVY